MFVIYFALALARPPRGPNGKHRPVPPPPPPPPEGENATIPDLHPPHHRPENGTDLNDTLHFGDVHHGHHGHEHQTQPVREDGNETEAQPLPPHEFGERFHDRRPPRAEDENETSPVRRGKHPHPHPRPPRRPENETEERPLPPMPEDENETAPVRRGKHPHPHPRPPRRPDNETEERPLPSIEEPVTEGQTLLSIENSTKPHPNKGRQSPEARTPRNATEGASEENHHRKHKKLPRGPATDKNRTKPTRPPKPDPTEQAGLLDSEPHTPSEARSTSLWTQWYMIASYVVAGIAAVAVAAVIITRRRREPAPDTINENTEE